MKCSVVKFIEKQEVNYFKDIEKYVRHVLTALRLKRKKDKQKNTKSGIILPPAQGSKRGQETPTKPAASVAIRGYYNPDPNAATKYFNALVQELGLGTSWDRFEPRRPKRARFYETPNL